MFSIKPKQPSSLPTQYAVIVNGATEKHHLVNVERAIQSFRSRNPNTKIIVISPHHPDAKADHFISTQDFSKQGYKKLDQVIKGWKSVEKDQHITNSQVTLYTTGHGSVEKNGACVSLDNDSGFCLPVSDILQKVVAPLQVNQLALVADGCKSGVLVRSIKEFTDKLKRPLQVEVMTAGADEENVSCQDFAPYFFSMEVKDLNNDGLISYREAFAYTIKNSPASSLAHYLGYDELTFSGVQSQAAFSSDSKLKIANSAIELEKHLTKEPGKFNLVMFTADWCVPCKIYRPKFAELAKKHGDQVNFIMARKQDIHYQNTPGDWSDYSISQYPTVAFINHRGEITKVDNNEEPFNSFYEAAFIDKAEIDTYYQRALDPKNSPEDLLKMIEQLDKTHYSKSIKYAPLIAKLIEHPNLKVRNNAYQLYFEFIDYNYYISQSFLEETSFLESPLPFKRMAGLFLTFFRAEKMSMKADPAQNKKVLKAEEILEYEKNAYLAIGKMSQFLEDENRDVKIVAASFLMRCAQFYVGLPAEVQQKLAAFTQDKRKLAASALKIDFSSVQEETLKWLGEDLETAKKLLPQIKGLVKHPNNRIHIYAIDTLIKLLPQLPNLEGILRKELKNPRNSARTHSFIANGLESAGKAIAWQEFLEHTDIEIRYEALRHLTSSKRHEFDLETHWNKILADPELKRHPRINPYLLLKNFIEEGILLEYGYKIFSQFKNEAPSLYAVQANGTLPLIKLKLGKPLTLRDLKEISEADSDPFEEFPPQLVLIAAEDKNPEKRKAAQDLLHSIYFSSSTLDSLIPQKSASLAVKLFSLDTIAHEIFEDKEEIDFDKKKFIKEHDQIEDYIEKQLTSADPLIEEAARNVIYTRFKIDHDYAQKLVDSILSDQLTLKQKIVYLDLIEGFLSKKDRTALRFGIQAPFKEWLDLLNQDNKNHIYITLTVLQIQSIYKQPNFSKEEVKALTSKLWNLSQSDEWYISNYALDILSRLKGQERPVEKDLKKRLKQFEQSQSSKNPEDVSQEKQRKTPSKETIQLYQSISERLKEKRQQLDGNSIGILFNYELTGLKNHQSSHLGMGFNFLHRKSQWGVSANIRTQMDVSRSRMEAPSAFWGVMDLSVGGRYFLRRYPKTFDPYLVLPELGVAFDIEGTNNIVSGKLGFGGLGFSINWKIFDFGLNTMLGMRFDKQRMHLINSFLLNASIHF